MPLPIVVMTLPQIVGGIVSIFGAAYGLLAWSEGKSLAQMKQEIERMILDWVVSYAAHKSGLKLNEDDPLSDASLCNAFGERTGVTIRTLKDKNLIKEDLNNYAAQLISSKSGFVVHSVTNVEVLKNDLLRIGAAEMTVRLGLPVGVMPGDGELFDAVEVKKRLMLWAKAEMLADMSNDVNLSLDEIRAMGNIDALANDLNTRLTVAKIDKVVTGRQIAVSVANGMAEKAVVEYQSYVLSASKLDRKRVLNRAAQAKFRAAHGNRQRYIPLGMNATIA